MYRLPLMILALFFLAGPGMAQSATGQTPGEMMARISIAPPDSTRIDLLMQLGGYYIFKPGEEKVDLDSAMIFLNRALDLSKTLHSINYSNQVLKLIGDCYLEGHELEKGKAVFMEVIDYYHRTGDIMNEVRTWARLGDCIPTLDGVFLEEKAASYEHARNMYHQLKDTMAETNTLKEMADAHMCAGKLDLAEKEFLQAIVQYRSIGYTYLHYTYDLLATVCSLKGFPDKELYYNLQAIKNMEYLHDTSELHTSYYKIAGNYVWASMYNKGLEYYHKAFELDKKRGNYGFMYAGLNDIANCMSLLQRSPEAIALIIKTVGEIPPTSTEENTDINEALAGCYSELHQYDKAQHYYEEMIRLFGITQARGRTNFQDLVHYYERMGNFFVLTRQYQRAGIYLQKLSLLPQAPGVVHPVTLARIELLRFRVDSASGDYISAIKHYEQYKRMHDSLFTATKTHQLEELQIQYETEKKDKDLLLQTKNIQILTEKTAAQQSQVEKTRVTRNAVIGGSCVLFLLLVVSYNRYRLKRRSNLQLQTQQKEISAKNTELEQLLRENQWLLREVHHRVKNNLQIVMSLLNSQSAYLQDEAALNAVLESQHRVQAMSLIHQKLYKSNNVSSIHMPEYISDLVEYLKDSFRTRRHIYFDQQIDPVQLDVLQAVPLGLILNEVITNALKYAFPCNDQDKITIRLLRSSPDQLVLTITDNGRGLPKGFDIEKNGSFGMTLIRGLAEDLDGKLTIENKNGTALYMTFKNTRVPLAAIRTAR